MDEDLIRGCEAYFETLAEVAAGRQLSDEVWRTLHLCHDSYFV